MGPHPKQERQFKGLGRLLREATSKDVLDGVVMGIGMAWPAVFGAAFLIWAAIGGYTEGRYLAALPVTALLLIQVMWSILMMFIHSAETRVKREVQAPAGSAQSETIP